MANVTGGPHALVAPVPASGPRSETSLVAASVPPVGGTDVNGETRTGPNGETVLNWSAGIKWRPENVAAGGTVDPCSPGTFTPPANLAQQMANPVLIWAAEKCSTMGERYEEARGRAERLLEAITSKRVARELWRGDRAAGSAWPNPYFTRDHAGGFNAPVVGQIAAGAVISPIAAFAALEQAIGEKGTGARGMIHATRRTVSIWIANRLIHREGGLLLSELGTIVVADAGYDGSGPDAGGGGIAHAALAPDATGITSWAYATGIVTLRLGPIETSGQGRVGDLLPTGNNALGETVTRDADDIVVIAQRLALATFDPAILVGVKIDHSTTANWSTTIP